MEWLQKATNPWGQEILVRAGWDVLWLVVIGSALFLAVHLILRRRWVDKAEVAAASAATEGKVDRHSMPARLFHWLMAASMLVLLGTGFLPILGIQFSWLAIHWISGLVLIGTIVFHILHVIVRRSWMEIWVGPRDIRDWWRGLGEALSRSAPPPDKPGKYPVDNKLYHHAVVITGLGAIVTGVLMMFRIDTPLWERNPYLFEEGTWGLVYVIHGFSSIALVGLVIAHIYFAILPEKRWMTVAMIYGWIARKNYVEYYDPERWKASGGGSAPTPETVEPPAVGDSAVSESS